MWPYPAARFVFLKNHARPDENVWCPQSPRSASPGLGGDADVCLRKPRGQCTRGSGGWAGLRFNGHDRAVLLLKCLHDVKGMRGQITPVYGFALPTRAERYARCGADASAEQLEPFVRIGGQSQIASVLQCFNYFHNPLVIRLPL
jgi:hypothetical protein